MIRRLFVALAAVALLAACSKESAEESSSAENCLVARLEVEADREGAATRLYDNDLNWYWESADQICGYQIAGNNLRNTLAFVTESGNFLCEAFEYMSTEPEQFHFIYPAAAEVSDGVLMAVQDGKWRPLSVTTTQETLIEAIPTISFEVLSAALELRIFAEDKTTPVAVAGATIESESDFVGKWTLQEDMTYVQSLVGKSIAIEGLDSSVVVFNMPDCADGFAAESITLTLTDADGGKMTRKLPAMTFVKGKRTVLNLVYTPDSEDGEGGGEVVEPEPEEPEVITGTFTCATYNVDGLPEKVLGFITLNGDGPGSSGTTTISQRVAASGWDVVTFQENFSYNTELQSAMTNYTFGTHRTFSIASALGTADTDGLGFATLNSTCSFSGESWWAFDAKEGGLTEGANTSIKKGVRHYVVSFGDGVVVDFLVTHMNTADNDAQITAQNNQLTEVANYINSIRSNNRPIIFMGDMNTRYTRNDYQTYFWSKLDTDLVVADPWVEYSWNGVYPTLGSASLMVPSKDSSSTLTEQTGEVVDKIIYINNPNATVQIKANSYLNDTSYEGVADHKPIVAEFTYSYTKTE